MKTRSILACMLFCTAMGMQMKAQDTPLYPANRAPLQETPYIELRVGAIKAGGWLISVNVSAEGGPSFFIRSTKEDVNITYKGQETIISENGYVTTMRDELPELEI